LHTLGFFHLKFFSSKIPYRDLLATIGSVSNDQALTSACALARNVRVQHALPRMALTGTISSIKASGAIRYLCCQVTAAKRIPA